MTPENEKLFGEVLTRLKAVLPAAEDETDWTRPAFRWVRRTCLGTTVGRLEPVEKFARVELDDLLYVEGQKAELLANTEQFVKGLPANNVLLTGARGTGKSSLIRGCLTRFYDEGLRLIEIDKDDLRDLADIVRITARAPSALFSFAMISPLNSVREATRRLKPHWTARLPRAATISSFTPRVIAGICCPNPCQTTHRRF